MELNEFCLPSLTYKINILSFVSLTSPLQVLLFLPFIQPKDNKFVDNTCGISVVKVVLQTLAALFAIISPDLAVFVAYLIASVPS